MYDIVQSRCIDGALEMIQKVKTGTWNGDKLWINFMWKLNRILSDHGTQSAGRIEVLRASMEMFLCWADNDLKKFIPRKVGLHFVGGDLSAEEMDEVTQDLKMLNALTSAEDEKIANALAKAVAVMPAAVMPEAGSEAEAAARAEEAAAAKIDAAALDEPDSESEVESEAESEVESKAESKAESEVEAEFEAGAEAEAGAGAGPSEYLQSVVDATVEEQMAMMQELTASLMPAFKPR